MYFYASPFLILFFKICLFIFSFIFKQKFFECLFLPFLELVWRKSTLFRHLRFFAFVYSAAGEKYAGTRRQGLEREGAHVSAGAGFSALFEPDVRDAREHDDELVRAITRELLHEGVSLREKTSDGHDAPIQGECLLTDLEDIVRRILFIGAQHEREARARRRNEGIAAALERGVRFGRRPKPLPKNFENAVELWRKGALNISEASRMCGMARTTFRSKAQQCS